MFMERKLQMRFAVFFIFTASPSLYVFPRWVFQVSFGKEIFGQTYIVADTRKGNDSMALFLQVVHAAFCDSCKSVNIFNLDGLELPSLDTLLVEILLLERHVVLFVDVGDFPGKALVRLFRNRFDNKDGLAV